MDRVAALFDLDKTLLDATSGWLYARYMYRKGRMTRRDLARVMWWNLLNKLGILSMEAFFLRWIAEGAGVDAEEMQQACDLWFMEDVLPHLTEIGRQRVAEHQAQGHVVAIVSASTQYVVRPMAAYLGLDERYVCTRLRIRDGRLTGEVESPICYGPGKVVWAERFAAEEGLDLGRSYFYTDSISDRPLLERVGHPVAVNPDRRLRELAQQRGWPIEYFW